MLECTIISPLTFGSYENIMLYFQSIFIIHIKNWFLYFHLTVDGFQEECHDNISGPMYPAPSSSANQESTNWGAS